MEDITITLPVYMGEQYIKRAMDSIYNQTDRNFKLIVVCDKGPDKTLEILEKYKTLYDFKLVVNEERVGQTPAFNQTHSLVDTKYIAFFMDDDELYPTYIEEVRKCIKETGADFIRGYFMKGQAIRDPVMDDNIGPFRVYTKKLWEEVGGYLGEWDFFNDTDFWYRVKYHEPQYKTALIRKPLYLYHNVADNVSNSPEKHSKRLDERVAFTYKWLLRESRYFETKDSNSNGDFEGKWLLEVQRAYEDYGYTKSICQRDSNDIIKRISTASPNTMILSTFSIPNKDTDLNEIFKALIKYGFTFYPEPSSRIVTKDRGIPIDHNGTKYFRLCAFKDE
jgi:glycosyltransferase involved in cell wall biosynthesis